MSSNYRAGFGAVEESIQKAATQQNAGSSTNLIFWDGKKNEKKIIRFLNDEPITIGFHEYILCNDGKRRNFTCTEQLAKPRPCTLCKTTYVTDDGETRNLRPRELTLALVAERDEKPVSRGVFEYSDKLHDIEVSDQDLKEKAEAEGVVFEGNTAKNVPQIGLIQQAASNFWSNINGYYVRYGTVSDRDYEITRQGANRETKYVVIPCDKVEGLESQEELDENYKAALVLHPTIVEYIERLGAESFYKKHLGENPTSGESTSDNGGSQGSSPASSSQDQGQAEGNQTQFGSLRDKLLSYKDSSQ